MFPSGESATSQVNSVPIFLHGSFINTDSSFPFTAVTLKYCYRLSRFFFTDVIVFYIHITFMRQKQKKLTTEKHEVM